MQPSFSLSLFAIAIRTAILEPRNPPAIVRAGDDESAMSPHKRLKSVVQVIGVEPLQGALETQPLLRSSTTPATLDRL